MEDAHCAELDVDGTSASFFGVYDGHGGIRFFTPQKKQNKRAIAQTFLIRFNSCSIYRTNTSPSCY